MFDHSNITILMASSPSSSPLWTLQQQKTLTLMLYLVTFLSFILISLGCPYTSIFSFGDSLADTGNLFFSSKTPWLHLCCTPPYGQTYFGHPTGRCSDGRLIIDFIAESLKIPYVKAYEGIKNGQIRNWTKEEGVNFAVSGATALNASFFEERGIVIDTINSLGVQLGWLKEFLPSICNSSSNCKEVFGKSLFLVGEIGGNDFNAPLYMRRSLAEIITYVPHVINSISSAIGDLMDLGAQMLVVPGNLPLGCNVFYLTMYESKQKADYDEAGCLVWLNKFAEYYNERLQAELNHLQEFHPHVNIVYADYYKAALPLYQSPTKFGFTGLKSCFEGGGKGVKTCDDPSKYTSWDGFHLTEAAYKLIARNLLIGFSSKDLCLKNNKAFESFNSL